MNLFRNSIFLFLIIAGPVLGLQAQDVVITDISSTPVSCGGASDGTISVNITGGNGSYYYLLLKNAVPVEEAGPVSSQTYTFSNHDKFSSYLLIVDDTDTTTDFDFRVVPIGGPDPIQITYANATDIQCNNSDDGVITVRASGEKGNYIFDLTGPHSQTNETGTFTGLPQGNYTVAVSDRDGCPSTDVTGVLTIENPDPMVITVDQVRDLDCFGDHSGSISISVSGGRPFGLGSGYTYNWTGPNGFSSSAQDISNLQAGEYTVTVYDGNLCAEIAGPITLTQPNEIIAVLDDFDDVSCNGGNDGSVSITPSGGAGGFTYSWEGQVNGLVSTQEDPSDLPADTYNLTITDADACSQTFSSFVTINQPLPISASSTRVDIDCFGEGNGSIDLSPSGGTPAYRFAWTGPSGFTADTEDISDLEAGAYSVTITDANDCVMTFNSIDSIQEPEELLLSSVKKDISCGGVTDGAIDITVSGGTLPYLYSWKGPAGFTASSEDISDLRAGNYKLSITDGNGCTYDFPNVATIQEPPLIVVNYISQQDILCNGESTGSIEIDASGGVPPLIFRWTNSSGTTVSTDEDPTGLPADTYSLTVSDANGCTADYPDLATLTEALPLQSELTGTDVTCFGDGNGTISVSALGGTSPYEYSNVGETGPYQSGTTFTSLGPGIYTVWTRDANLCISTATITILEPEEIKVVDETISGDILCSGDATAQISIELVSGGVPPYMYSINGGVDFYPTSIFTNLPAGSYQTVVRDASGCTAMGKENVISEPAPLQIGAYSQVDISSCYDALEGAISITATGGTGSITYTLDGSITNTTGEFQNLAGGSHYISMEDANGCTLDTTVFLLNPSAIVFTDLSITNVTGCFGDASGVVHASASGGTGNLSFSLDGGLFQSSGTFSGLIAGTYTMTLKDESDCTLDTVFSITQPEGISSVYTRVTPISCAGANDGSIEALGSGGTPPLSYTLTPGGITNNTGLFPALAPDTYSVHIRDSEGCIGMDTIVTLTDPPSLVINSLTYNDVSCYGAADGSISISVSGGVAPYVFSVDNQASWSSDTIIGGLTPDSYEVYVRDAHLCTPYAGQISITEPPQITLSVDVTDIQTCSGDTTGAIEALATGGTGNMEYSLDDINYLPSGSFTSLTAGLYTVYVKDETGCDVNQSVDVNEPDPISATITKTDAIYGNLGTITITGSSGGTPPYVYSINGAAGPFTSDTAYTDLEAGNYHVIVRDLNNCTYEDLIEILDVAPLEVIVNISHVSCFGENDGSIEFVPQNAVGTVSYSIDSGRNYVPDPLFENLPGNTTYYLVAIDEAAKVFVGTATILEPAEIILTSKVTPAECNAFSNTGFIEVTASGGTGPLTYLWSDGSTAEDRINLGAGMYTLEVTDGNNCTISESMTIGSQVSVFANAGEDTTVCYGESLQLRASGRHTASWDPSPFITDPNEANPLTLGITQNTTFVLTITEEISVFNCYNKDSIHVSLYPQTGLIATEDTFIILGTSVQLEAIGGPFQEYRWEPEAGLNSSTIPNPIATPLESISYYVYGTNEYGCEEVDSVFIEVIEDLRAYNVFTPNGDGINEYFEIQHAERFPEIQVEVYNRWGSLLYSSTGYDSSTNWDGTTRGKEVPVGTYYYVIIPYRGAKPFTGHVTIIR
ncbi:MAG: gliding motility-associated C-terminal domain-containing protein [Bacteroidota bacterium]